MNARSVNAAAGVVQAAWAQGRRTAAGVAMALDAAQLLMSPETAAELARLREERHSTNESVDDAARALREKRDQIAELEATSAALRGRLAELETQRAALAERLRAGQTWERGRLVSEDYVSQPELRTIFGIPLAAPLDGITRLTVPVQVLRAQVEDQHDSPLHHDWRLGRDLPAPVVIQAPEPAVVCRCDEPGADPYECEADDCTGEFSELNPFSSSARPVNERSAEVSRTCKCGWSTSVWHVDDGSAEEELHRHVTRVHGGTAPVVEGAGA